MLPLPGSVPQFAALVEVDGALERMVRLALCSSRPGRAGAIIIYWNTLKLGDAVFARGQAGLEIPGGLLAHVSPLGWEHINLTGEYRWPGADRRAPRKRLE